MANTIEDIQEYLKQEEEMFKQGKEPSHEMIMNFLESCYEKFKGSSQKYAEKRGFKLFDKPMPCMTESCVSSADSKIPKRKVL